MSGVQRDMRAAAVACSTCPVRRQCLAYATTVEGRTAATYRSCVYGGLTPSQRHAAATSTSAPRESDERKPA